MKPNSSQRHYLKVKLSFLIAILVVIFLGVFAVLGHHRLESYISSLEETDSSIQEVRAVKRIVSEVQLGARSYMLNADNGFQSAFNESQEAAETSLKILEKSTESNPRNAKRVAQLRDLLTKLFQDHTQIIALKNNGNIDEAARKMQSVGVTGNYNNLRQLLFEFEREEANVQQSHLVLLNTSTVDQRNMLYLGFGIGIFLLLISGLFVMRTLRQKDRAEAELNRFFASSPDMFCIVGLDTNFKRINPVFEELLGYSLNEIMSKSFMDLVHPEDRETVIQEISHLKTSLKPVSFDSRYLCKDGSFKWFSWKTTIVPESAVFYGVARNITDKKQLEQDNIAARKAAMAASEAKSQFLANMSHEIRTPMNGVLGLTKLLLDSPLNAEQKEHTENIFVSAQNLLMIINDILDFSKIESGKMSVEKVEFDLNSLLVDCEKILKLTAMQKDISFHVTTVNFSSALLGDPTRIRQVLLNLVSNALKFTHEGSVQVQLDTLIEQEHTIRLKFSVIDTGIGISEKAISKMFKAFSQADDSTSRKFGGTGLGLSICKQLVELMGGKIGLQSTEGHGSTFWFELTFEKGRELKTFKNANQVNFAHVRYNGHVLVADDNLINQKVIAKTLNKLGLKVDLADNGNQVLAALDKNPLYNLVFMDCHMPELDGFETTHRIRSNIKKAYNKIPIVALTANLLNVAKDKCLQAGMNDFLSKPIEDQKLHEVLAKFLEKSDNAKVVSNDAHDTPKPKTEFSSVDLAILEKLNALQEEGEPDIIIELIHSFLGQTPTRINAMVTALAAPSEASYEIIYDEAHTIKSSARTMGGKHLGELCQELEDLRNSAPSEKVKTLCENIQSEYGKMANELNLIIGLRQQSKVA